MNLQETVDYLNQLAGKPAKIAWKEVKAMMAVFYYFSGSDMARMAGFSRAYVSKKPTPSVFDKVEVLGKSFFRLKVDDKNRFFKHLKSLGFEQKTRSIFTKGEIEIKIIDNRFIRISLFDQKTQLDFSVLADMHTADLSLLSML